MSEAAEWVWHGGTPAAKLLRALLVPLSWLYGAITRLRALAYDRGWRRHARASVPVVSVGNLRVGGTGKTPLVIWLVQSLRERGLHPVVVSRGYGAALVEPVAIASAETWSKVSRHDDAPRYARVVVDDSSAVTRTDSSTREPADAGPTAPDEALLTVARTGSPVVCFADRATACEVAETLFDPDVIVLDDGFQHLRLARDLDVVVLAAGDRGAHVLPAGPLREPWRALGRADVLVGTPEADVPGALAATVRASGLVRTANEPVAAALTALRGKAVVAVCGIARPARFLDLVDAAGARVIATIRFADHHRYDGADWRRIAAAAEQVADLVVTTEKDLVKLAPLARGDDRLLAVRVDLEVAGGAALVDRIAGLDARGRGDNHRGLRTATR